MTSLPPTPAEGQPRWITVQTEGPVRKAEPTKLRVTGHPRIREFVDPDGQFNNWDGYWVVLIGEAVTEPAAGASWWRFEGETETVTLEIHLIRAGLPGAPAFAEVLVEPGRDISKRIVLADGIEHLPGKAQDEAALTAMKAWRAIEGFLRVRRPAGSYDYENEEEYARAIWSEIYDKPDRARALDRASEDVIAGWLGISAPGLPRYRARFGIGIRDIRRRRVRRPNS